MKIRSVFAIVWSILAFSLVVANASAQIRVDETWGSAARLGESPLSGAGELRKLKKLGLQTTFAGATGLVGLGLEVNATESISASLAAGVSRGFHAFNLNIKKYWSGDAFSSYVVGGYSSWSSSESADGAGSTSPGFFSRDFLSERERRTGEFAENILYPGAGVQYLNTAGEWRGFGLFAEVLWLVDFDSLHAGITGGIGSIYYF